MIVGPATKRPMILAIRFLDGKIIDASKPQPHQAVVIEFPILIAV
jgi:hypothetical protein